MIKMAEKYTFPIDKEMVCAKTSMSVSTKAATEIAKAVNRKPFKKSLRIVQDLSTEKIPLKSHKYHTKAAKEILALLNNLQKNADSRSIGTEDKELFLSVHQGPTMFRSRRKRRFGFRMKMCHAQAVLVKMKTKEAKPTEKRTEVKAVEKKEVKKKV